MRQFSVLIFFLALNIVAAPLARAQSGDPSSIFFNAYMAATRDGPKLEKDGKYKLALQKYRYAVTVLQQIREKSPDWQPVIVTYRLSKTTEAIALVQKKIEVEGPGPTQEEDAPLPQGGDETSGDSTPPAPRVDTAGGNSNPFKTMQQQYEQMQKDLEAMRARYKKSQDDNAALVEKYNDALKQIDKDRVDQAQTSAQLQQAEEAYKNALADKNKDAQGQKEVDDEIARLQNAWKQAQAERDAYQDANEEEKQRITSAREQRDLAFKQRDEAVNSLNKAKEGQQQVDKLMADNAALTQKLSDAEKTISSLNASTPEKDAQIASLKKDLSDANDRLVAAQKQSQENLNSMNDLQQQLESTSTELADAKAGKGASSEDTQKLTDENKLLRGIVIRERKEEAHRDQEKQLALAELRKLQVPSASLAEKITDLAQPVLKLTDEERALFKQTDVTISDNSISIGVEKPGTQPEATAPPAPSPAASPAPQPSASPAPVAIVSSSSAPVSPAATPLPAASPSDPLPQKTTDTAPHVQTNITPPVSAELIPQANEAKLEFERGHYREAEKIYMAMMEQEPNNIYILSNLGVVRFRSGKLKPAEEIFKKALAVSPDDEFSHRTLGIVYYSENNYDYALSELTKAITINQKDAIAHNYLGITASAKGWQEAAREQLEIAVSIDPNYQDAHFNLAVIYVNTPPIDKENAKKHYKKAIELGSPPDEKLEQLLNK